MFGITFNDGSVQSLVTNSDGTVTINFVDNKTKKTIIVTLHVGTTVEIFYQHDVFKGVEFQ